MTWLASPRERLRVLLAMVALHSAGVGLGLMLQPAGLLASMGFAAANEPFFPAQGGAFHVIVAVGYAMAAIAPERRRSLVVFAALVKALATVFLLAYWLLAARIWTVLASGIVDGLMALAIVAALRSWRDVDAKGDS